MIITQNSLLRNPKKVIFLLKKKYKEKGFFPASSQLARLLFLKTNIFLAYNLHYKTLRSSKKFELNGKELNYFYHPYNATWKNERIIEVPIIANFVHENEGKRILEVGHVLAHYFPVNHEVLDKYEEDKGVINEDIINFSPKKKYDLITSISTLEHVGWDENPKEPEKIRMALKNLKKCLKRKGKLIFTIPIGENPYLDGLIKNEKIKLDEQYFFKKISRNNEWKQVNFEEAKNIQYNKPFPRVNGIVLGVIKK